MPNKALRWGIFSIDRKLVVINNDEKTLADIKEPKLKERSAEIWRQIFPSEANDKHFGEESMLEHASIVLFGHFPKVSEETMPRMTIYVTIDGTNAAIVQYAVNNP